MELADPEVITALLEENERRTPKPRRSRYSGLGESRPVRPRRCQCGACAFCVDNARWERIFNEKFADPNYYHITVPQGSSLGWLGYGRSR